MPDVIPKIVEQIDYYEDLLSKGDTQVYDKRTNELLYIGDVVCELKNLLSNEIYAEQFTYKPRQGVSNGITSQL